MIVQRLNLNLIPNQSPVIVHVNQYDTGTGRLIATLYEGNEPYSPNGTAVIQGTKPDGHGFQYTATLDGNVVTADLTEQMSPVAGDVRAQIVVTESSGVTGTFVFIMRVQPSALPSDADMSESDYPLIEEAIREAQEAVIDSHDNAENSEAWAQGTRGGIPVGPTDPTYEHNAEYWAHQAEGAASGVSSFNGRSGSVLPIAGDYDSEKILLASALHIGGETQSNVQEALEALVNDGGAGHTILNGLGQEMPQRKNLRFAGANLSDDAQNDTTNVTITGGSGGSTITVTTIETTLYGETVTITDGTSTFTGVFDNSGVCVIDGVTVTGTLTVSSGAASRTLNVPYFGNYTVALSFWAATINVSTDPDVVSAIVKKDGVQIDTISFSAGSGVYIADSTGAYTFTATVGGIDFTSPTVNVTQQTTYSTIIDIFNATLSISTSSSELYGKTITIKKGSTTVGTTAFSAQGSASYTVHETGTYTLDCEGYTATQAVSEQTTYNVSINAGLDLASWITAGSTTDYPLNPSSYADFSALEADEAAVRQLMTVHASVDFLAQATAGDSLMESVINSDVCAKWINLSDYALDTLYANSDIASEMDSADKYFYGEWGIVDSTTTPPTWGALGNVPVMTANNAPYGVASASSSYSGYQPSYAFDNDSHGWVAATKVDSQLAYEFVTPVNVKSYKISSDMSEGIASATDRLQDYKIQGYDGSTWVDLTEVMTYQGTSVGGLYGSDEYGKITKNAGYYLQYRVYVYAPTTYVPGIHTLQFYGRELKPLVPTMTGTTTPKGEVVSSTFHTSYPAWKTFNDVSSDFALTDSSAIPAYIGYKFDNPVSVQSVALTNCSTSGFTGTGEILTYKLEGSNDGTTWTTVSSNGVGSRTVGATTITNFPNTSKYTYWRIYVTSITGTLGTNAIVIQRLKFYCLDYSEKEFAQGSTRKTIYDHGVKLVESAIYNSNSNATGREGADSFFITKTGSDNLSQFGTTGTVDLTAYNTLRAIAGLKMYSTGSTGYCASLVISASAQYDYVSGTKIAEYQVEYNGTAEKKAAIPYDIALDISNVNTAAYVLVAFGSSGSSSVDTEIRELWLE